MITDDDLFTFAARYPSESRFDNRASVNTVKMPSRNRRIHPMNNQNNSVQPFVPSRIMAARFYVGRVVGQDYSG